MDGVHRTDRVRGERGHDVGDPRYPVRADVGEVVGALLAEGVGQGVQDVLAMAVCPPFGAPAWEIHPQSRNDPVPCPRFAQQT